MIFYEWPNLYLYSSYIIYTHGFSFYCEGSIFMLGSDMLVWNLMAERVQLEYAIVVCQWGWLTYKLQAFMLSWNLVPDIGTYLWHVHSPNVGNCNTFTMVYSIIDFISWYSAKCTISEFSKKVWWGSKVTDRWK